MPPTATTRGLNPSDTRAHPEHEATVSVLVVRGLLQAVERAGIDRSVFLRAGGVDTEGLDSMDARLPQAEVLRLCELAVEMSGDPAFALHWAENLSDRMFVPISHLLAHCTHLRHAFEMLAQFYQLISDRADYQIREEGQRVLLECARFEGHSERVQRFVAEVMTGGFWYLIRCFNQSARPLQACFAYPAPAYHSEYGRLFHDAALFEQPFTGLVFDRALLYAPALGSDGDLRQALQSLVEGRLLKIVHGSSAAAKVREYLLREGWPHRSDMASVARALRTSTRTLRRRLAEEGKSYADVLSEASATIAKTFLRGQRHTIQEVAYEMGFSDAATFHRAFKRWTGMTPSTYRRMHQKTPAA